MWLQLDDGHLTPSEWEMASMLSHAMDDYPMATVQTETLDEEFQPLTTITVIQRPTERILIVVRKNRSILVATDDIQCATWREDR
jgi:hypothetical protein